MNFPSRMGRGAEMPRELWNSVEKGSTISQGLKISNKPKTLPQERKRRWNSAGISLRDRKLCGPEVGFVGMQLWRPANPGLKWKTWRVSFPFVRKSRDSNIAELYTVNTEQCLGIETYFTTVGKTWCSARSLLLIHNISFSVTQAPVMIIRGVLHSECLSSKGAVLVTHFCDLVILGNKHAWFQ